MSGEINMQLSVSVRNNFLVEGFAPGNLSLDMIDASPGGHSQLITTAESVLDFGDKTWTDSALLVLRNTDWGNWNNYIEYGPETGAGTFGEITIMGRLYPGQTACCFIAPSVVLRAQAAITDAWLQMYLWPIEAGAGTS